MTREATPICLVKTFTEDAEKECSKQISKKTSETFKTKIKTLDLTNLEVIFDFVLK